MKVNALITSMVLMFLAIQKCSTQGARRPKQDNILAEMQVVCQSSLILLKLNTNIPFNGMIYAKDAQAGRDCISEYRAATNITFRLPLKSCGTLFTEVEDGIEYFNTLVVQPHMRLMTNRGKGYNVRCKYQTRERTIANNHFNVSASFLMQDTARTQNTPLLATAPMPSCTMKIFRSGKDDVAETVKVGDKLIMVIEIDQQDIYGMRVSNCVVRDGMNIAEQQLINEMGCPIDETIMPEFEYSNNFTRATVSFPAHKFPHTSSIYYQCNVRLCINNGNCGATQCIKFPVNNSSTRSKRFTDEQDKESGQTSKTRNLLLGSHRDDKKLVIRSGEPKDLSFDVHSNLFVKDLDVEESNFQPSDQVAILTDGSRVVNKPLDGIVCVDFNQTRAKLVLFVLMALGVALIIMCQVGYFGKESSDLVTSSLPPCYQRPMVRRKACHVRILKA